MIYDAISNFKTRAKVKTSGKFNKTDRVLVAQSTETLLATRNNRERKQRNTADKLGDCFIGW